MTLVSRIYSQGPAPEPTGRVAEDRDRAARTALWHRRGVAVIDPEDILDEWLRQAVINYANGAYGQQRQGRK